MTSQIKPGTEYLIATYNIVCFLYTSKFDSKTRLMRYIDELFNFGLLCLGHRVCKAILQPCNWCGDRWRCESECSAVNCRLYGVYTDHDECCWTDHCTHNIELPLSEMHQRATARLQHTHTHTHTQCSAFVGSFTNKCSILHCCICSWSGGARLSCWETWTPAYLSSSLGARLRIALKCIVRYWVDSVNAQ